MGAPGIEAGGLERPRHPVTRMVTGVAALSRFYRWALDWV